jgi:hypothetical protein
VIVCTILPIDLDHSSFFRESIRAVMAGSGPLSEHCCTYSDTQNLTILLLPTRGFYECCVGLAYREFLFVSSECHLLGVCHSLIVRRGDDAGSHDVADSAIEINRSL